MMVLMLVDVGGCCAGSTSEKYSYPIDKAAATTTRLPILIITGKDVNIDSLPFLSIISLSPPTPIQSCSLPPQRIHSISIAYKQTNTPPSSLYHFPPLHCHRHSKKDSFLPPQPPQRTTRRRANPFSSRIQFLAATAKPTDCLVRHGGAASATTLRNAVVIRGPAQGG